MPTKLTQTTLGSTSSTVSARFAGKYPSTHDFYVRDVVDEMIRIEPYQTPLLTFLFASKSVKWRQTANLEGTFEFPEKEMVPNVTTVTDGGTAGSPTITIKVADTALLIVGKSVKFEESDETGIVTSVSGDNITITRDISDTGATQNWTIAPSAGSYVFILGEAMGEDDNPPYYVYTEAYMRKNRVQLFEKTISMSDILIAATKNGGTYGGNWWAEEVREKAIEMKRDMEFAFWFNQNHFAKTTNNKLLTKTEGIIYTIENRGGFIHNYGSSCDRQSFIHFLSLAKRGKPEKTLFVGNDLMNDIEEILYSKYSNVQPVTKFGPIGGNDTVNVLTYRTAALIVDIVRNPLWEGKYAKYGVLIDNSYLYGCHFADDNKGSRKWRFQTNIQNPSAPRTECLFLAHVGIGLAVAPLHGILKP